MKKRNFKLDLIILATDICLAINKTALTISNKTNKIGENLNKIAWEELNKMKENR